MEIEFIPDTALEMDSEERAAEASRILNSVVYNRTFADLELELMNEWHNSEAGETENRERIHMAVQLLTALRTELRIAMESGKIDRDRVVRMTDFTTH